MALVSIEVERPEEDYRCFKIIFRFKQNRFLDDDIIQKELISTNGRVEAILHPIRWKKDMALSGMHAVGEHCGQERHLQDSFFDFFYDTSDESIEFANVLMSVGYLSFYKLIKPSHRIFCQMYCLIIKAKMTTRMFLSYPTARTNAI